MRIVTQRQIETAILAAEFAKYHEAEDHPSPYRNVPEHWLAAVQAEAARETYLAGVSTVLLATTGLTELTDADYGEPNTYI